MSLAALSKLRQSSQQFISTVRGGTQQRNRLVGLAAARAVVNRLSLPSAPVENPTEFFAAQSTGLAEQLVGELNEFVVLSVDETLDFVQSLWKMRYRTLYPQGRLFTNGSDPFAAFLGLSSLATQEVFKTIYENEAEILRLANGFIDLLDDLLPLTTEPVEPTALDPVAG